MPGKDDLVLQTILENCSDPQFNVNALAEKMGRSLSFLRETVCTHYGMGVHELIELIETIRLEQALKVLASNDDKIDYVRTRVGYLYSKSFRRALKKRLGLTPCECRQRLSHADNKEREIEHLLELLWGNTGEIDR